MYKNILCTFIASHARIVDYYYKHIEIWETLINVAYMPYKLKVADKALIKYCFGGNS
jgi:hypothetical protein